MNHQPIMLIEDNPDDRDLTIRALTMLLGTTTVTRKTRPGGN